VKTVPDKCPFCESPIMVHVGNLLRSEDGGFATYKCKTVQDVRWDEKYIRDGQSDVCRILEVQLLTKQRDEARERIKRLEEAGDAMLNAWLMPEDSMEYCDWIALSADAKAKWYKAKEAKP
jgi:hypothetical protein